MRKAEKSGKEAKDPKEVQLVNGGARGSDQEVTELEEEVDESAAKAKDPESSRL